MVPTFFTVLALPSCGQPQINPAGDLWHRADDSRCPGGVLIAGLAETSPIVRDQEIGRMREGRPSPRVGSLRAVYRWHP